jgi:hypothetical protein
MNLRGLVRELRLMKDQPSHRFYGVLGLIFVAVVLGLVARSLLVALLFAHVGK